MEHRRLGDSGLVVSSLGLGTLTWGAETDEDEAEALLSAFRSAGGTLVATSDAYGDGAAEHVLGRLLAPVDRAELVLATQAGAPGLLPLDRGTSRRRLLAALDDSLDRLGTDHVDLWQLAAWDAGTPLAETLAAVDTAVSTGRVRYAGVVDHTGWQTALAAGWQRAVPGRTPLVSAQVEYSLLQRGADREVLPAAAGCGLGVLAAAPLGHGVLAGRYRAGTPADSRAASPARSASVAPYLRSSAARTVDAVVTAADGLGVSPLAVALAWVRDRPGVAAPLVGARTARQLGETLDAVPVVLPDKIREVLDDISAPDLGYPEAPRPDPRAGPAAREPWEV